MAKAIAAKTMKVMDYIRSHPNMPAQKIADKWNMHKTYIYKLKHRIKDEDTLAISITDPTPGPTPEHEADARASSAILDAKRTVQELKERVEKYFPGKTLEEKTELAHAAMVESMRKGSLKEPTNVDAILDARAENYGKFIDGAEIMQMLKRMVHGYIEKRGTQLAFDQRESIDMMVHKLGRIINGNPDHVDSWRDIAGYATLVADRLEGNAR